MTGRGSDPDRQFAFKLDEEFGVVAQVRESEPTSSRPFSIRLSPAERVTLEREAGRQPLGAYVRARLLEGTARRAKSTLTRNDTSTVGQVLAKIGKLQWSATMVDLAAAAKRGTIVITPELHREIEAVCADIREVRRLLFHALGLYPKVSR